MALKTASYYVALATWISDEQHHRYSNQLDACAEDGWHWRRAVWLPMTRI